MGFGRLGNFDLMRDKMVMPRIHVCGRLHDKADMVEPLRAFYAFFRIEAMQRQVIVAGRQVNVICIRLPFHLHPDNIAIKLQACVKIGCEEGNMAHPSHTAGPGRHGYSASSTIS